MMSSAIDQMASHARSWRTRWALWRNRMIGSAAFQDWAMRTPIVRAVARRKAAAQFDLVAGFVYSQITSLYVTSGLLMYLRDAPRSALEVGAHLVRGGAATERILKAGAAIGIAESPEPGLWTLGERGAALSANPGAMAMIEHHALLYRDLADPMTLLTKPGGENGALSRFWTYAAQSVGRDDGDDHDAYSSLMKATQPMVWQQVIGRYDFARHRAILDVGGGSGAFIERVGEAAPAARLGLFDLPAVAAIAEHRLAATAIGDRVTCHGGSFREAPVPHGYDLVTLVRILHDHDDPVAQELLRSIFESLPAAGRLLIVEPMAGTRGAESMGDAYFGIYLWAMGSGRPRSEAEITRMLKTAGFSTVKRISTPLPLVARAMIAER